MQEFRSLFKKNKRKKDFREGNLELKEEISCIIEGVLIVLLFSYFFYRSYLAVVFLSPIVFFYRKYKMKQLIQRKREQLELQFKETILAVQSNLQAGYSMENAFVESYQDVLRIYGENSYMAEELRRIQKGIKNGNTLENMLMDLADRCPDSEIAEFAQVYSIACKTGSKWNAKNAMIPISIPIGICLNAPVATMVAIKPPSNKSQTIPIGNIVKIEPKIYAFFFGLPCHKICSSLFKISLISVAEPFVFLLFLK